MPIDYKKLWILLIQNGISKPELCRRAGFSPATLTKLNKNEFVSMDILVKICRTLKCDIGDILEIVKECNNMVTK